MIITILAWSTSAVVSMVLLSIATGTARWRVVIFLQSVTPLLSVVTVAVTSLALIRGQSILAAVAAVQTVWILGLVVDLFRHRRRPTPPANGSILRVAHSNVLHSNSSPERAAADILACDAHIIAFSEITATVHGELEKLPIAEYWPHRIHDLRDGPRGVALWSKLPFTSAAIERLHDCNGVVAIVEHGADSRVLVLAVHPMAPVSAQKTRDWVPSLRTVERILTESPLPAVAIGDYNATHWHPPLRRIYRRGVHSAHLRIGRVLATTFPVGRRLRPFIGIDHALVTDHVNVHGVDHFEVAGSDHRGIVIDVSLGDPDRFRLSDPTR